MSEDVPARHRGRFRLIEKLPPRVPYLRAARAEQPSLKRQVEIRILRGGTPEDQVATFFEELQELANLDHRCFLPVLNDMSLEGRPCYTVPMREHPDVGSLVGREDFTLEDRCQAVRSLAGALHALHERDILLGPVPPELVAWDSGSDTAYLRHHKTVDEHWERGLLRHTPLEAEGARERHGPRDDVFYWGVLSFWLISRGQHAYGAGPEDLRPLRRLVPELAETLASVIEASCAWEPGLRPGDGSELLSVLQLDNTNIDAGGAREDTGDKVDIHAVSSRVLQKVDTLRSSGRMQAFLPPLKKPAVPTGDTDAMLRSDDSLVGLPKDLARLAAEARKRGLQPEEPGQERSVSGQLALVLAVITVMVLGFTLAAGRPPWESAPPPAPTAPPKPTAAPQKPPPEATKASSVLALDPELQQLLGHQGDILEDDFQGLWRVARSLVEAKKLPDGFNDKRKLAQLVRAFRKDPKQGGQDFRAWIDQIRAAVLK